MISCSVCPMRDKTDWHIYKLLQIFIHFPAVYSADGITDLAETKKVEIMTKVHAFRPDNVCFHHVVFARRCLIHQISPHYVIRVVILYSVETIFTQCILSIYLVNVLIGFARIFLSPSNKMFISEALFAHIHDDCFTIEQKSNQFQIWKFRMIIHRLWSNLSSYHSGTWKIA